MKNYKPYSKNSITFIDGQGKKVTVEVSEEIATVWNHFEWNDSYNERKRRAPVKGSNVDGNILDFDDNGNSKECSWESLLESVGEPYLGGYNEGFEDAAIEKLYVTSIFASIIPTLSDEEINILNAEINGLSSREYEEKYHTARKTYLYRREKLFSKIRKTIEERESGRGQALSRM